MKLVLFFFVFFSAIAFADVRKDKNHACATDFPVYCKEEEPSDANHWNCLGRKMNILSTKCTAFMEGIYLGQNACGKEILSLCPGTKKNYGNWYMCLISRKSEVSGKCSKMLTEIEARYARGAEAMKACSKDKVKHCGSLEPRQCMNKIHKLPESELSPECKAKLATMK